MKLTSTKTLIFILFLLSKSEIFAQQNLNDYRGVWINNKGNTELNKKNKNFYSKSDSDNLKFSSKAYTDLPFTAKGTFLVFSWSALQKKYDDQENTNQAFNWAKLDQNINAVFSANPNSYVGLMIWTGKSAPDWLYTYTNNQETYQLIKYFETTDVGLKGNYPDYLDREHNPYPSEYNPPITNYNSSLSTYEVYWRNMILKVIQHLNTTTSISGANKDRILFLQSAEGTTGDMEPYQGKPLHNNTIDYTGYTIIAPEWIRFLKRSWAYTADVLKDQASSSNLHNIHLLLNTGGVSRIFGFDDVFPERYLDLDKYHDPSVYNTVSTESLFYWVTHAAPEINQATADYLKKSWRKSDGVGHYYQLNYEQFYKKHLDDLRLNDPTIFTRDEYDSHQNDNATYPYNFFTTAASALYSGLDMWMADYTALFKNTNNSSSADDIPNDDFTPGYELFNNNAAKGSTEVANAFCFLKVGLDASEISTDLPATCSAQSNVTVAYKNLCGESWTQEIINNGNYGYSWFGAKQEDPHNAQGQPLHQRNDVSGVNDVGWYIYSTNSVTNGNYEKYIYQLGAAYELVLPEQSSSFHNNEIGAYGRFGRRIGWDYLPPLLFDIDDHLGENLPFYSTGVGTKIKVTFYDSGDPRDGWELSYGDYETFPAFRISGDYQNSGAGWKTLIFDLGNIILNYYTGEFTSDFEIHTAPSHPRLGAPLFSIIQIIKYSTVNNPGGTVELEAQAPISISAKSSKDNIESKKTELEPSIMAYPNPTTSNCTLRFINNDIIKKLLVYNSLGKIVFQKNVNNRKIEINKNELGNISGVYFIDITNASNKHFTTKISIL